MVILYNFQFYRVGFNTTRGTLLSLMHILATRPNLQKSLQQEVDQVIGSDREPTLQDRRHCPLVEATIFETMRYISHIPLSIPHYASSDVVIGGYTIPKGTTVTIQHNFM